MAKNVENYSVAKEIRKEYLKEHLDSVKSLIARWTAELSAPDPLAPVKGLWGWQRVYRPPAGQYADNNHLLRRHVRSRALWNHHANWERKLDGIWHITNQVREQADLKHREGLGNEQRQYSEDYTGTVLWKGFELARGRKIERWYKVPDDQRGVAYGAYKIEMSVTHAEERSSIEREHWDLIRDIAELSEMKELTELRREVLRLEEQIQAIAGKILKSNDILYPCRFCRHLWK